MYKKLSILSCFLLIGCFGYSQDFVGNIRWVGLKQGISHQFVRCIRQDANGLMWLGTSYGLNRFDGYGFKTWTPLEDSLAAGEINFLLEDQAGWIWAISTKNPDREEKLTAISLVHSKTGEVKTFEKKFGKTAPFQLDAITHFFAAPDNSLFFRSENGFWKYLPDRGFESIPCPGGVRPLNSFDGKTFWGSSASSLVHFDGQGVILHQIPYNKRNEPNWLVGNGVNIWLRALNQPLIRLDPVEENYTEAKMDFRNDDLRPVSFDPKRNWIWVAKEDDLFAFDHEGRQVFDMQEDSQARVDAHIINLYVDSGGLLWLGTRYGVYILEVKPNRFEHFLSTGNREIRQKKTYPCRDILGVGDQLFVNTYSESYRIDLKQHTVEQLKRTRPFADSRNNYALLQTRDGSAWTASNHLSRMDIKTGEILEHIAVPGGGFKIWALHEDHTGAIWLNKGDGIFTYKNGRLSNFQAYNGFSDLEKSNIYYYHETKEGKLWLGTDSGLYELILGQGVINRYWSGESGEHYLPGGQIQYIHEDEAGYFWMATENEGLLKWHPQTRELRRISRADGLPTNTIYAVFEDERNYLWLSTYFGLVQMDKTTLWKKIYLPEDGIAYPEFNRTSYFQAEDGRIFLGGQEGISAFYPKDFWSDWEQEKLASLRVYQYTEGHHFGREKVEALERILQQKKLEFTHDVRFLSFKIMAPNYFLADKISFHYKVETLSRITQHSLPDKWIRCENNTIDILGLTPGRYRINIEARRLDGERVARLRYFCLLTPSSFPVAYN